MPSRSTSLATSPKFAAITPSDTTVFDPRPRAIYVGVGGRIDIAGEDDTVVAFLAVPSGWTLDVCPKKVMAANTTATDMVALY